MRWSPTGKPVAPSWTPVGWNRSEAVFCSPLPCRHASQQHPRFAFLPAQGRGFRRRRVKKHQFHPNASQPLQDSPLY